MISTLLHLGLSPMEIRVMTGCGGSSIHRILHPGVNKVKDKRKPKHAISKDDLKDVSRNILKPHFSSRMILLAPIDDKRSISPLPGSPRKKIIKITKSSRNRMEQGLYLIPDGLNWYIGNIRNLV